IVSRQVLANETPHQRAFHMKGKGVGAGVNSVCAIGSFVSALRILLRPATLRLRIALHHLNGSMAILREHKHSTAFDPVQLAVCARLLQPGKPPCPNELAGITSILSGGRG